MREIGFERYEKTRHDRVMRKLRELLDELPPFATQFFVALESTTTELTRMNYARDLKIFFNFLVQKVDTFKGRRIRDLQVSDLSLVTVDDLYIFLDYLNVYVSENNDVYENRESGKGRKLACLKTFFKHFYRKGAIKENVCQLLDSPKQHEKPIVRLESNEVIALLEVVEKGEGLTAKQLRYHRLTVKRDLAILVLFLKTGIRVSELIGLNIEDLDFANHSFVITRKGGSRVILYFDEEVGQALSTYLEERRQKGTHDPRYPLFISLQKKRMSVSAVQNLVQKYAKIAAPLKRISPHKLRSTFGTMLYAETGDIYLVADVLGHKNVNTTRRHYAAQSDQNRRLAASALKLRS